MHMKINTSKRYLKGENVYLHFALYHKLPNALIPNTTKLQNICAVTIFCHKIRSRKYNLTMTLLLREAIKIRATFFSYNLKNTDQSCICGVKSCLAVNLRTERQNNPFGDKLQILKRTSRVSGTPGPQILRFSVYIPFLTLQTRVPSHYRATRL